VDVGVNRIRVVQPIYRAHRAVIFAIERHLVIAYMLATQLHCNYRSIRFLESIYGAGFWQVSSDVICVGRRSHNIMALIAHDAIAGRV